MAEYRNVSDRYYNYDSLGEATTLAEAHQIYANHLAKEPR